MRTAAIWTFYKQHQNKGPLGRWTHSFQCCIVPLIEQPFPQFSSDSKTASIDFVDAATKKLKSFHTGLQGNEGGILLVEFMVSCTAFGFYLPFQMDSRGSTMAGKRKKQIVILEEEFC